LKILLISLLGILVAPLNAQEILIPIDSVYMAGYKAVYYTNSLSTQFQWNVYLCDNVILSTPIGKSNIVLQNYCPHPDVNLIDCHLMDFDINGNGEVLFCFQDSAGGERNSVYIYSLDTTATLLGEFDGIKLGYGDFEFEDLDHDHIPEAIFRCFNFQEISTDKIKPPTPYLVWKWNGTKFKLANFRLTDAEVMSLYLDIPDFDTYFDEAKEDSAKASKFDPTDSTTYPIGLMKLLIIHYYSGRWSRIDVAINDIWPNAYLKSKALKIMIKGIIERSPFWQELQESNW
jgi:hypothetical protein